MKKYLWMALTLIVLVCIIIIEAHCIQKERDKRSMAENNVLAYSTELSNLKEDNIAYKLTVEQLEYFNDSIFQKLDSTRKALKVKDKELKALHYIASTFTRTDTIVLKDTIFRDYDFRLDTTLMDRWYTLDMSLLYPSVIVIKPEFRSEKHVVIATEKRTVNPPKKCWLLRLFQRKHRVVTVQVSEQNPYVESETDRYVEVVD